MTAPLSASNLHLSYGKTEVLKNISLDLPEGKISSIVGANASGKSSLLRCLARVLTPTKGTVILEGALITEQRSRDVARKVALLSQTSEAPDAMRVMDLVIKGRTPHQSALRQWSTTDQEIVEWCCDQVGLSAQMNSLLGELSGGQRQRAWIAMVLAQDTGILLLDEPTTFLDLPHQIEILNLIQQLQNDRCLTVAMVLHDINLATRYSDHIVAVKNGEILLQGAPDEVVSVENMHAIYGLDCTIIPDPDTRRPHVIAR
ncbi:MAG: ABC transporter ATP-binding protein [Shimia sp.]|nr:ABC transporter ATP-binding protein [Shimia sp.]